MKTLIALLLFCVTSFAQSIANSHSHRAPVIALTHVRIIDGTGAASLEDQTIVIAGGKIQSIGATIPEQAHVLDLKGYTVLPGLVGMHNHLFFPMGGSPPMYSNMGTSFPRLYLALGVTTIRTTGSVAPYTDLEIKRLIDSGRMIGPKMHVTAPYLEGVGSFTPVMHELQGPEDARRLVNFWADQGATSFKAYMNISRAELRAVVEEAHKRGLKVTGHLCSIGYREAAEIGMTIRHGCSPTRNLFQTNNRINARRCGGPEPAPTRYHSDAVKETIRTLVAKNVAITSTLPVFEASAPLSQTGIGAASAF